MIDLVKKNIPKPIKFTSVNRNGNQNKALGMFAPSSKSFITSEPGNVILSSVYRLGGVTKSAVMLYAVRVGLVRLDDDILKGLILTSVAVTLALLVDVRNVGVAELPYPEASVKVVAHCHEIDWRVVPFTLILCPYI